MASRQQFSVVGYVFGFGTLADDRDPLVLRTLDDRPPVWGSARGFRRRWNVAMRNIDRDNDHKYYIDAVTHRRDDIYVVSLNAEVDEGCSCAGLALPVSEHTLRLFDQRERYMWRFDVSDSFSVDLDLPVWIYRGNSRSTELYAEGLRTGKGRVRKDYKERVEAAFQRRGSDVWRGYKESTDSPEVPVVELDILRADGDRGL